MPPTPSATRSGQPKLSEQAKHLVAPQGIVATAWPAVRKTCAEKMGVTFDPWQDAAGRVILAKRADGNLASMIDGVGLSLPRQVGKTYLIGSTVFALCINMPGLLVIWSAHHARTHGETFLSMQSFAERQRVAPHVRQVFTGSGDEEIRFHNGSRILFGARERGFGRGIPGVDVLIFDEAQILSDKALSNMLATMNTSRFGLQLYIGTPPKPEDMSEAFKRMRTEALEGRLADGAWIEFGADAGADGDDRKQWARANPSFPKRTPVQSLLRLKRKLTAEDWLREGLGIWDQAGSQRTVIEPAKWAAVGIPEAPSGGVPSYGVKFSVDGLTVALAGAVKVGTAVHVELIERRSMVFGVDWLAEWLAKRAEGCAEIVIDGKAGRDDLVTALRRLKVPPRVIHPVSTDEVIHAHTSFLNAVNTGALTHSAVPGQQALDDAVANAGKRKIGTAGGWGWDALDGTGDMTPLDAATLAHHGAATTRRKREGSGTRRAVVL